MTKNTATLDDVFQQIAELTLMMSERFEAVDRRFDGIDKRLDGIDVRLDTLEDQVRNLSSEQRAMRECLEVSIVA